MQKDKEGLTIGVLDIYGFEIFMVSACGVWFSSTVNLNSRKCKNLYIQIHDTFSLPNAIKDTPLIRTFFIGSKRGFPLWCVPLWHVSALAFMDHRTVPLEWNGIGMQLFLTEI